MQPKHPSSKTPPAKQTQGQRASKPTNTLRQNNSNNNASKEDLEYKTTKIKSNSKGNSNRLSPEEIMHNLKKLKESGQKIAQEANQQSPMHNIKKATKQLWQLLSEIAGGVILAYVLCNILLDKSTINGRTKTTNRQEESKKKAYAICISIGATGGLYSYLRRIHRNKNNSASWESNGRKNGKQSG